MTTGTYVYMYINYRKAFTKYVMHPDAVKFDNR